MINQENKKGILLRTKDFAIQIIQFGQYLKERKVEYFLRDQIARSGSSIGANVHEAKASSSTKEFCRFYEIALRSGYETEYWLQVIYQLYSIKDKKEFEEIENELVQINKILASIIIKLKYKITKEVQSKQQMPSKSNFLL